MYFFMVRTFRLMIVLLYINRTNIPPIMITYKIYETQNLLVAVAFFLPGRAKDLSAPLYCLRRNYACFGA